MIEVEHMLATIPPAFPKTGEAYILAQHHALGGDFKKHGMPGQLAVYGHQWNFIDLPLGTVVKGLREGYIYQKLWTGNEFVWKIIAR